MTPSPHTQPRGFQPIQRTEKRDGDFEYIWRNGNLVPVAVQSYRTVYSVGEAIQRRVPVGASQ